MPDTALARKDQVDFGRCPFSTSLFTSIHKKLIGTQTTCHARIWHGEEATTGLARQLF
ncbi:MAG: hypothetical protein OYH77_05615 [Pseudomonadota bacterium]|nr:hypothetical protein [Pseudomonadota bacterium]